MHAGCQLACRALHRSLTYSISILPFASKGLKVAYKKQLPITQKLKQHHPCRWCFVEKERADLCSKGSPVRIPSRLLCTPVLCCHFHLAWAILGEWNLETTLGMLRFYDSNIPECKTQAMMMMILHKFAFRMCNVLPKWYQCRTEAAWFRSDHPHI